MLNFGSWRCRCQCGTRCTSATIPPPQPAGNLVIGKLCNVILGGFSSAHPKLPHASPPVKLRSTSWEPLLQNSDVMLLPSVVSFSFLIAPPRPRPQRPGPRSAGGPSQYVLSACGEGHSMGGEPRGLGPGSAEGHSMDGGSWGLGALPRARGSGPGAGNACLLTSFAVLGSK